MSMVRNVAVPMLAVTLTAGLIASATAALASKASGQRGDAIVRAHSASKDIRAETASAREDGRLRPYVFAGLCCERADDTRPEPGSSAHAVRK
jgi:hypothetical protein